MGTFTLSLKEVIKYTGGTTAMVNGNVVLTGGNIGIDYYPIFDEAHRPVLNGKIIDRYWNREIGLETIDMFQMSMRRKLNEIMPAYNQLYKSTLIDFDPLSTIDIKSTITGTASQTGESEAESVSTSDASAKSRSVNSDTPQTMLQGNADYATSASDANSTSNNGSQGTQNASELQESQSQSESQTKGYQGVASDLVMRFRDSIINVDLMILDALEECFMGIWDNGDSYTNNNMIGYR